MNVLRTFNLRPVSTGLFVDVAETLRTVKNLPKTFEDLTIKLINDVPQRYKNVVYFVCEASMYMLN